MLSVVLVSTRDLQCLEPFEMLCLVILYVKFVSIHFKLQIITSLWFVCVLLCVCLLYIKHHFFAFSYRYIIPNSFVRFISRLQIARKLVYAWSFVWIVRLTEQNMKMCSHFRLLSLCCKIGNSFWRYNNFLSFQSVHRKIRMK